MGSAVAGARQVDMRIRIDAPQAGIAPQRSQRLDDPDTGAVSLNDQGRYRIRGIARDETGKEQDRYGPEN